MTSASATSRRSVPPVRCGWVKADPLYEQYHDQEWGVPVHDDRQLFEMLTLGGAQAGLSWLTILRKREGYRRAFAQFDPRRVARFGKPQIEKLLENPQIVRNRLKVESAVHNAQRVLEVQADLGSLDKLLWQAVDGRTQRNHWKSLSEIPARTPESDRLSKELTARGFKFVGSTICYALMQAAGLVDDHLTSCFRYRQRPARHRK